MCFKHNFGKSIALSSFLVAVMVFTMGIQSSYAKTTLKYLHSSPFSAGEKTSESLSTAAYLGALDFMFREHSALKGKYELKYVSDVFKDPNECLAAVASGAGHFTYAAPQFLEQYDPRWKVFLAPGAFDDFEHFLRTIETPVFKKWIDSFQKEKGLTIVKWMANLGHFYLFTNTGPITKFEDLKGQKIRYNGARSYAEALKQVDATAIALPYTEVVTALQTNMIEGLLNDIYGRDFYNLPIFTKYLVPISWGFAPMALVVNTKWWESLPANERQVMMETIDRVDVYKSFDRAELAVAQAWDEDERTELVRLSPEEEARWKEQLLIASKNFTKDVPAEFMDAIVQSRKK